MAPSTPRPGGELRATLALALPVALVQLGTMLLGVVDTIIVGHLSGEALAAVALANLYFMNVAIPASGLLLGLDPVLAQAVGAGDHDAVRRNLQRGLVLVAAVSVLAGAALVPAGTVLRAFDQPSEVVPVAARYLLHCIPGVLPFLAFNVLRQALQALHRTRAIVITIVVANVLNALLDWILVFGRLGSPAFGVVGSAWATTACRWAMALALLGLGWRDLGPLVRRWTREALDILPLARLVRLGAPIGVQQMLEVSAFGAIGLLMGRIGVREMAAHEIALNLAALTFFVPLGIAAAAAVRVGHAIGAGDQPRARAAARAAIGAGVAYMSCTALAFLSFPGAIARVYSNDATIVAFAATLLPIAGVFQVFDGAQAVGAGVLRGAGDTRAPLVMNLLGFWMIGIPTSALLAFTFDLGARGLWWGFVAGLGAVAVFLTWRVVAVMRRPLARVDVESARLQVTESSVLSRQ